MTALYNVYQLQGARTNAWLCIALHRCTAEVLKLASGLYYAAAAQWQAGIQPVDIHLQNRHVFNEKTQWPLEPQPKFYTMSALPSCHVCL